jgi:uncharacterized phage infection (PIP) family protein YhgE
MRVITNNVSTPQLTEEYNYTLARLNADPLGAPYLPTYQDFLKNINLMREQELRLQAQQTMGQALIDFADDNLDRFVDTLSNTLLQVTSNDREHVLWRHYFGSKSPSVFKKPILGKQLEEMRRWLPSLKSSTNKALQGLSATLEPLLSNAEAAAKGKSDADQAIKDFRNLGSRKELIVTFNTLRKDTFNGLDKLIQTYPEKNLPKSFGDQFFRQARTDTIPGLEEELTQLQAEIEENQQALVELQARYQELSKQKAHLEEEEAQHQRDLAALAAAEEAAAALRAKLYKK